MADVVNFPARVVESDHLPEPGNRYQAYALWHRFKPPTITLVLSTWSMTALRYDDLGEHDFRSLSEDGNYDGDCVIGLIFSGRSGAVWVVITGRKLYRLYADLGAHRVSWLWEFPEDRATVRDSEPVIRSITIRAISSCGEAAGQGDTETSGVNAAFMPSV